MDLDPIFAKHGVVVERPEPIPSEWYALLDEALGRLVASGWKRRQLRQVKEKFGTLRILVNRDGESEEFLRWATMVTIEVRERSCRLVAHST